MGRLAKRAVTVAGSRFRPAIGAATRFRPTTRFRPRTRVPTNRFRPSTGVAAYFRRVGTAAGVIGAAA